MRMLLNDFRAEYRERVLAILWRQWTALGVTGTGEPWTTSVVDPDALLLITCTVGRWDARLFDAALEWLQMNGRFVNVQRLRRMLQREEFSGEPVLRAVAASSSTSSDELKWMKLAGKSAVRPTNLEPLFFLEDETPLPVVRDEDGLFASHGFARDRFEPRGIAEEFRPERGSTLLLRLRALLGLNARCEVLSYLLLNPVGSPRQIARDCYYSPATISKVMAEMARSGFVAATVEGRHKRYRLVSDSLGDVIFEPRRPRPGWCGRRRSAGSRWSGSFSTHRTSLVGRRRSRLPRSAGC